MRGFILALHLWVLTVQQVLSIINIKYYFIFKKSGMSALMRKELLDKAGGFEAFGCYLAEDFFFAKCITVSSRANRKYRS